VNPWSVPWPYAQVPTGVDVLAGRDACHRIQQDMDVQTLEHLSDAQPKPALLLAMHAVTVDPANITNLLGVDIILKLINRYMARAVRAPPRVGAR
jgi:hypothetical protein